MENFLSSVHACNEENCHPAWLRTCNSSWFGKARTQFIPAALSTSGFTLTISVARARHYFSAGMLFYVHPHLNAKVTFRAYSFYCLKAFVLSLFVFFSRSPIKAQHELSYALHANIIYRFTKYIEWPPDEHSADFIIGIVGDTPLYNELKNFTANKTAASKKIIVKKISASAGAYACHILFVSRHKTKSMAKIADLTRGNPVLLISENDSHFVTGACINFVIVNEHLKLEINKENIESRQLNVASELLQLGTLIK